MGEFLLNAVLNAVLNAAWIIFLVLLAIAAFLGMVLVILGALLAVRALWRDLVNGD